MAQVRFRNTIDITESRLPDAACIVQNCTFDQRIRPRDADLDVVLVQHHFMQVKARWVADHDGVQADVMRNHKIVTIFQVNSHFGYQTLPEIYTTHDLKEKLHLLLCNKQCREGPQKGLRGKHHCEV